MLNFVHKVLILIFKNLFSREIQIKNYLETFMLTFFILAAEESIYNIQLIIKFTEIEGFLSKSVIFIKNRTKCLN